MCEQLLKGIVYLLAVKSTEVLDLAHQNECVALWCSWIQFPPFTGALSLSLLIYREKGGGGREGEKVGREGERAREN